MVLPVCLKSIKGKKAFMIHMREKKIESSKGKKSQKDKKKKNKKNLTRIHQ